MPVVSQATKTPNPVLASPCTTNRADLKLREKSFCKKHGRIVACGTGRSRASTSSSQSKAGKNHWYGLLLGVAQQAPNPGPMDAARRFTNSEALVRGRNSA